jgi:hypothetical protein
MTLTPTCRGAPTCQVVTSKQSRQHVSLFTYTGGVTVIFAATVMACALGLEGSSVQSLWGWMSHE